ncbi:MAG TPA: hypothetical protein VN372_05330 [Methanospirillum sp.]|nr:hypothetical protein [Methanospirillum sp.]
MSDSQIKVITAQTEENLTGIVLDGMPYLYWLRVYKALGITKAHAVEVIKRLTEGVHYRKFTKEEIQLLSGTVKVSDTVDTRARAFYFLTQEGMNRAYIEIDTNRMSDPDAVNKVHEVRDKIANIYTRYQRGEVLSITVDKVREELSDDTKTIEITSKNLAIADAFIKYACPHLKIDPGRVISNSLTRAEQEIHNYGGRENLEHLKCMIPRVLEGEPATLNATDIGKHLDMAPRWVNEVLEILGYQTHRYRERSSGKHKVWSPTQKGIPHGEWRPVTKGHNNGSIHNEDKWYWKESILPLIRDPLFG